MSARMVAFRAAQRRVASMREEERDERAPWGGLRLDMVAERVAGELADRLVYVGGQWRGLADGRTLARAVVVAAVADRLPADIAGERRTHIAALVVSSVTFRTHLTGARSTSAAPRRAHEGPTGATGGTDQIPSRYTGALTERTV